MSSKALFFCCLGAVLWVVSCRQPDPPLIGETAENQLKLLVQQSGIYQVSLQQLQEAGLGIETLKSDQLALTQSETAVPYLLQGDALIFYGLAPTSRYTTTRPYLLTVGQPGLVMAQTAVSPPTTSSLTTIPLTLRLEENHLYEAQSLAGDDSDLWFWQTVNQGQIASIPFELPAVSNGSGTIRLHLWGFTYNPDIENDHDFNLLINEQLISTVQWDGNTYFTAEISIPPNTLQPGSNTLALDNKVAGASFLDIFYLNWIEITYQSPPIAHNDYLTFTGLDGTVSLDGFSEPPILLDTTNPAAPVLLTANSPTLATTPNQQITAVSTTGFLSPILQPVRQSNWHNTTTQADLLIITTDELAPALQPLVAARQEQGLQVAVVPVAQIYDEFGFGEASPTAIQTFIQYAYANWQAPPRYLLLVGDATTDYRNYLGLAPDNLIPAPMVPVVYSGETISDARLADTDGDLRPNLAMGRWPASTPAQVASLVERTLAYEQGTAVPRTLFTADGSEPQFATLSTQLQTDTGLPADTFTLLTNPSAAQLTDQWNQGAWLATYVGHGSLQLWGKEAMLTAETIPNLHTSTPPIVLQLTCLTGLFAHPEQISLSEEMLHAPDGPVLIVAATSLTLSSAQQSLATEFIKQLQNSAVSRIGDAFQTAKLSLNIQDPTLREISDTYVLLGDPSALIIRPQP